MRLGGRDDRGMAVALVHGGVCREAVEVLLPLHVPHPRPFAAVEYDRERVIVVGGEAIHFCEIISGGRH